MNTQLQDLEWARPKIDRHISKNRKRDSKVSVSGLFSLLRKQRHLSLIGDYFLFWIIKDQLKKRSLSVKGLKWALRKSAEYQELGKKEKMEWARLLI